MYNITFYKAKKLKSSKSLLMFTATQGCVHCKKRFAVFSYPAGMTLTKLSMAGERLASDIPAGDGTPQPFFTVYMVMINVLASEVVSGGLSTVEAWTLETFCAGAKGVTTAPCITHPSHCHAFFNPSHPSGHTVIANTMDEV
jgi:hypothetical protein